MNDFKSENENNGKERVLLVWYQLSALRSCQSDEIQGIKAAFFQARGLFLLAVARNQPKLFQRFWESAWSNAV